MHKFAFAKKFMKKGKKINLNNVKFYRSSSRTEAITKLDFYKSEIYLKKNIKKNQQIFPNFIHFRMV